MLCQGLTREQSNKLYLDVIESENQIAARELCLSDLFFLLTVACKRRDINRDWLYDRCREVEASSDGHLDLWSREHYKSSIITFGKSIQDLIKDPNGTLIGIFSHTRPIAKGFLDQIKRELETNEFLKGLFPDVLFKNPQSEAPKWSLDSGLILKRQSNPKESNIEAWGLVDGQPTGKHFTVLVYDDVVTRESVTTPEQIKKVTAAWELSLNLGAEGGKKRYIGTRYHTNDTYKVMMDRGSVIPRIYTATKDGTDSGEPVLMSKESLREKRRDMGVHTFNCQMLQNPIADKSMGFNKDWLKFYESSEHPKFNKYLLVDPAGEKKDSSDYTVMLVIGLGQDNNYYLLHGLRDRLNLTQRAEKLFELHREYQPLAVGYEKYGMQSDIEHMTYVMGQENYHFEITELGGRTAKVDRIRKLVPVFEQKRFFLPKKFLFSNCDGVLTDYVKVFIDDEFETFPVSAHDDMLDCTARILDEKLGATFPKIKKQKPSQYVVGGSSSWMG